MGLLKVEEQIKGLKTTVNWEKGGVGDHGGRQEDWGKQSLVT